MLHPRDATGPHEPTGNFSFVAKRQRQQAYLDVAVVTQVPRPSGGTPETYLLQLSTLIEDEAEEVADTALRNAVNVLLQRRSTVRR